VVRLPLYRVDLDTDIRTYGRFRAQRPVTWRKWHRRLDQRHFPEPVFGPWRVPLEEAVDEIHARKPADLVLATAAPYTFFAPAMHLAKKRGVPFVLDYRDGWALDVINDGPAFGRSSRRGRIERWLIDHAEEAWFVNTPIRDWYAERYPHGADRLDIVRNGSDVAVGTSRIPLRVPEPANGVTIGYLGTVTFTPNRTRDLCEAWKLARERDELVARSHLEFRGHIGAGSARGANGHTRILSGYADQGVSYGGPVAKGETADLYARWDALLLCLVGGKYVTSGKVYDYISTGLPIMSAHQPEHAAREILADYPLWVPNESLEVEDLAKAFVRVAHLAVDTNDVDRKMARVYADSFERYRQIEPAVARLSKRFGATA
jgi:glycosyltransferase involved in cell wall biosynthesis